MTYYYLISVFESLHWAAVLSSAIAFASMLVSKIGEASAEPDKWAHEKKVNNHYAGTEERKNFRKSCMRYSAFFGFVAIVTPPLTHWIEAKAHVYELHSLGAPAALSKPRP